MVGLYIIIIMLNFFSLFVKKGNKIILLSSFIFIWIIIGGNIASADVSNYISLYFQSVNKEYSLEFGYTFLEKLGNNVGFEYAIFRLLIAIPPVILLYFFLEKVVGKNENKHLFLLFYMSYLLIMDAEQIRNFIATTFVLNGLALAIKTNLSRFRKKLSLLFSFGIAFSVHVTSVFYMIFVTYFFKKRKNWLYSLLFFSILFTVVLILNNNQLPYLEIIIKKIDDARLYKYLSSLTNWGYLVPVFLSIIDLFWAYIMKKINDSTTEILDNNIYEFNVYINLLSFIFIPVYMMNINFYRLVRNLLYFNFACAQLIWNNKKISSANKLLSLVMGIVVVFVWFYYDFIFTDHIENVFKPILNYNFFLR